MSRVRPTSARRVTSIRRACPASPKFSPRATASTSTCSRKPARTCSSASTLLYELLRTYPDNKQLAAEILDLEHEGDRITHDIIDRLNHTFVTPIDREDILALASALDDVVDYTEEVADYLELYKIEAPMEQSIQLARVLKDASGQIAEAIPPAARVP